MDWSAFDDGVESAVSGSAVEDETSETEAVAAAAEAAKPRREAGRDEAASAREVLATVVDDGDAVTMAVNARDASCERAIFAPSSVSEVPSTLSHNPATEASLPVSPAFAR
mmetsp:Transcript_29889/g.48069  ORF Transcript_29889/g.48069 Transcript_29889/m.48069 type:complete len:111 (+) Transcript_29889:395-727(+)